MVGHSHVPFIRRIGRKLIVNPGSVGQPRSGRKAGNEIALLARRTMGVRTEESRRSPTTGNDRQGVARRYRKASTSIAVSRPNAMFFEATEYYGTPRGEKP